MRLSSYEHPEVSEVAQALRNDRGDPGVLFPRLTAIVMGTWAGVFSIFGISNLLRFWCVASRAAFSCTAAISDPALSG